MDESNIMNKDRDGYCSKHQKAAWWCRECLQEHQDQSKKDGFKNGITQGKREAWEKMRPYCDSRILDEDNYYCLDNNENPCNDFNQCPAMLTPDSGETKSAKEG